MSYADTANRPNPAAMFGALGVPGAIGALMVIGLAVTVVAPEPDETMTGWQLDPVIPPPPPEDIPPQSSSSQSQQTTQVVEVTPTRPESPITLPVGPTAPIGELPNLGDDLVGVTPVKFGIPEITPAVEPIAASPRGAASQWITNDDYRTSWINRGYEGRATFALTIDTRGRVSDCRITGSTGHAALDQATCRLLERRARFNPAQDSSGNIVSGTYSNSVTWQIPE